MITGAIVTVTDEATELVDAGVDRNGVSATVQAPSGGVTVYLGGADVSSTVYGHALAAGGHLSIELARGEVLYAVVASGAQAVPVLVSDAIGS